MKKIHLAFIWHQHQPLYKNPESGKYEMPWVRLHAVKDYYDMAAILDEFPKIKQTFNLVPSLLMQLKEYADGKASDKCLELTLKDPAELADNDKIYILHNFFMANWETMILPNNRYRQLLEKRGRQTSIEELKRIHRYFSVNDIRDLQVWFNLAWMDPYWREKDELVKNLYNKGRDFTEEEKRLLINKQLEICAKIPAKYKELQDRGQIELTTTPFYHPILPLLCDNASALVSNPGITLPANRFKHEEDAVAQVNKAIQYHTEVFGKAPIGMWPSEGSVSEAVVKILADAGIKWCATDEEILFRSNPLFKKGCDLFRPYKVQIAGSSINMVFRDHGLSDSIGFTYSKMPTEAAVKDFMNKIKFIHQAGGEDCGLITIILDGENCWEYYDNDGWDFLRGLYTAISDSPEIETVKIGEYLENNPPKNTLNKLWPGSWINANFNIWIGHSEDQKAWDYLEKTRNFFSDHLKSNPGMLGSNEVKEAWECLYAAEGSDWTWWYGDDHFSSQGDIFDFLFRKNLMMIYEKLGHKAPDYLSNPIKKIADVKIGQAPTDFIHPTIDGLVSNYYEWQNAGFYELGAYGGSMHQVETIMKVFYYGFDMNSIFFRFDLNTPFNKIVDPITLKIIFFDGINAEALLSFAPGGAISGFKLKNRSAKIIELNSSAVNKIAEIAIPIAELGIPDNEDKINFVVTVLRNNIEIERWPAFSTISIPKPSEDFSLHNWKV